MPDSPSQPKANVPVLPLTVFRQYWQELVSEWVDCKNRAAENKKVRRDLFSYFLFAIFLGQIGVLTTAIWSSFGNDSLVKTIFQQAKSGNFLTFQIALLLAGASKFFDEHSAGRVRDYALLRLTHLLIAFLLAFISMLAYIYLGTVEATWEPGPIFTIVNIALWVASMWIAARLHLAFAVTEEPLEEYLQKQSNEVRSQAAELDKRSVTQIGGSNLKI